jgi:hypothetical protein
MRNFGLNFHLRDGQGSEAAGKQGWSGNADTHLKMKTAVAHTIPQLQTRASFGLVVPFVRTCFGRRVSRGWLNAKRLQASNVVLPR